VGTFFETQCIIILLHPSQEAATLYYHSTPSGHLSVVHVSHGCCTCRIGLIHFAGQVVSPPVR